MWRSCGCKKGQDTATTKTIPAEDKGFLMSKRNEVDNKGDPGAASSQCQTGSWPRRPDRFGELLNPIEAAQYLRLDETSSHTPQSAIRTLNHWRQKGQLKATKFASRVVSEGRAGPFSGS